MLLWWCFLLKIKTTKNEFLCQTLKVTLPWALWANSGRSRNGPCRHLGWFSDLSCLRRVRLREVGGQEGWEGRWFRTWGLNGPMHCVRIFRGWWLALWQQLFFFLPVSFYFWGLALEVLLTSTLLAVIWHIPLWCQIFVAVVGFLFFFFF